MTLFLLIQGCNTDSNSNQHDDENAEIADDDKLFRLLSSTYTNINFENTLTEGVNTNVLMYEYFYNGGGVAIGDLNEDGLEDIYFSSNMSSNKLYLNRGNLKFEDVTDLTGAVGRSGPWKTGVTIADVNGDKKPDIFLSYSGKVRGTNRLKQLFINQGAENGIPKFVESAAAYGIIDTGYTTQAVFFDYDLDADLDLFILNHNPNAIPILDEAGTADLIKRNNPAIGVRLMQNNKNKFVDVTNKAGLNSSELTYGLGAAVSDINGDGWPDLYISNDYSAPDYLYINNKKGGFINQLQQSLGQTSHFSMGNNISDINNDGLPDIFTLDMLPESNERQKLLFAPDNYEKFNLGLKAGLYYQYMRNMLHVNNGNGTFSETAQFSGISNTDWSWAPLFADFDNDGWKDLFVTNGFTRDFTNMDFMKYMGDYLKNRNLMRQDILNLVQQIPSSSLANYMFRNEGQLRFQNKGAAWGFDSTANSNGAAYADLDNDGDLDLVVNNINKPAFVYENRTSKNRNTNYLKIQLAGDGANTQGLGAKVSIYSKGKTQFLEQSPNRGYQSVVSAILHFGLGSEEIVDSLRVVWPGGSTELVKNIKVNQLLNLKQATASQKYRQPVFPPAFFSPANFVDIYKTPVKDINDFKRQPLMANPLSSNGPCLVKADINGDGLDDVFAGGGSGNPASIFLQQSNGAFSQSAQPAFEEDKNSEDADAVFFDANGDDHLDLYVAAGGYHNYTPGDVLLQDRLYLNNGKGIFVKSPDALPVMTSSKGCVASSDLNGDGFLDLFVGGRVIPGRYPEKPESYLLINDGKGKFRNEIESVPGSLQKLGMITDAVFMDINSDKQNDLVLVGEWLPLTIFINENGKLVNRTTDYVDKNYQGWWNKLDTADLNNDGIPELIAGNYGLNSQIKANEKQPVEMYYKDFDDNGAVDPILCCYIQGKSYPYLTRDELLDQLSIMRTKFTDYKGYANTTLTDIFDEEQLKGAEHLTANIFETGIFMRTGSGKFMFKPLPLAAQLAPVYAIGITDYNKDGFKDIILGGNINKPRLRLGKSDANYGLLLTGDGKGNFLPMVQTASGFNLRGDTRSMLIFNNKVLFGVNHKIVAYNRNR
ncbi:VCBS repeat-containing protein [Flavitalea sp.]|nr:VCBS repeat-containing protein [Flavitalea sp.]